MHPQDALTLSIYKILPPSLVKIKVWVDFVSAFICPKSHSSSERTSRGGSDDLLVILLNIKNAPTIITIPIKTKKNFFYSIVKKLLSCLSTIMIINKH